MLVNQQNVLTNRDLDAMNRFLHSKSYANRVNRNLSLGASSSSSNSNSNSSRFGNKYRISKVRNEEEEDENSKLKNRIARKIAIVGVSVQILGMACFESDRASALVDRFDLQENGRQREEVFSNSDVLRKTKIGEAKSSERWSFDVSTTESRTSEKVRENEKTNAAVAELGRDFFTDFQIFIAKEPPVAVGFLFLFLLNGIWGVIFTLFIRETSSGPGGEFGKGVVALRKEIVKGIFKFFGGALGRFTKND